MSGPDGAGIELRLPEQLLAPRRLGPFPSSSSALKFLLATALGTVVAAALGALLWLPFVGGGFLLSVWRPEGRSLDERFFGYVRWRFRAHRTGAAGGGSPPGPIARDGGEWIAEISASGTPIAFLPAAELRRRFDAFRALLDGLDGPVRILVQGEPTRLDGILPRPRTAATTPEREARGGYRELLHLLVRRRRMRRARISFREPTPGPDGMRRLEARVYATGEALDGLEIPWERVSGRMGSRTSRRTVARAL